MKFIGKYELPRFRLKWRRGRGAMEFILSLQTDTQKKKTVMGPFADRTVSKNPV